MAVAVETKSLTPEQLTFLLLTAAIRLQFKKNLGTIDIREEAQILEGQSTIEDSKGSEAIYSVELSNRGALGNTLIADIRKDGQGTRYKLTSGQICETAFTVKNHRKKGQTYFSTPNFSPSTENISQAIKIIGRFRPKNS